jgi:hypothetical protein
MRNTTQTRSSRPRGRPSPPTFPVADLTAAGPFLLAPFTADAIGFLARRISPQSAWANVFPYITVADVEGRLTLVVGPDNWSLGKPVVCDGGSVSRRLTVFGVTHSDVGEGGSRSIQASTACKRCAIHFGIGRYLKLIRPVRLELGDGRDKLPTTGKGSPYVPDRMLAGLRATYEREVQRLSPVYGPVLVHPPDPWARPTVPAPDTQSNANGNGNGNGNPTTPAQNPHGDRVRNAAAARGMNEDQLANLILAAAGRPAQPPREAAALLARLLARIPRDVAERVLATLALKPSTAAAPRSRRAAPPAASDDQQPHAAERPHSPSGTVSVDFAELGPDPDSLAA